MAYQQRHHVGSRSWLNPNLELSKRYHLKIFFKVSLSEFSQEESNSISITLSNILSWCSDIMNHQQILLKLKPLYNKLSNSNHIKQDLKTELKEYLQLLSLILELKSLCWDKPTPDGQQTSVVSNTASIVKSQHSYSQWSSHHHWVSLPKWRIEHSEQIKHSPNNCKRATKVGSML